MARGYGLRLVKLVGALPLESVRLSKRKACIWVACVFGRFPAPIGAAHVLPVVITTGGYRPVFLAPKGRQLLVLSPPAGALESRGLFDVRWLSPPAFHLSPPTGAKPDVLFRRLSCLVHAIERTPAADA
jgi:hypothetical protein